VVALRLVEVLDGVAQRGARHGGGEPVEEPQQSVGVSLAGFFDPGFRWRRASLTCSGFPSGINRWTNRLALSWVTAVRVTVRGYPSPPSAERRSWVARAGMTGVTLWE
jgi:hypothetical protein